MRSHKSKKGKRKWTKIQAIVYKTLHGKLKIEHHEPQGKPGGELRFSGRENIFRT